MKKFNAIEQTQEGKNDLLNLVIKVLALRNDAALAHRLKVAPPVISKIRHNKLIVGATLVINIMEETGLSLDQIKTELGGAE